MLRVHDSTSRRSHGSLLGAPFDRVHQHAIVVEVEASVERLNRAADDEAFATTFRLGHGPPTLAERIALSDVWVGFEPDRAYAIRTSRREPHALAVSGRLFEQEARDPLFLDALLLHGIQHGLDALGLRRGGHPEADDPRRLARRNLQDLRRIFRDVVRPVCAACCGELDATASTRTH